MMIHKDKCLELGLPEPKPYDNQVTYTINLIAKGYRFNTRMARYCGIGNLHSITPKIRKKGYSFTQKDNVARCPFTNTIPANKVIVIWMTIEQIAHYKETKSAKKN